MASISFQKQWNILVLHAQARNHEGKLVDKLLSTNILVIIFHTAKHSNKILIIIIFNPTRKKTY